VAGQLDKQALEGAACTAALALSCVLAGSGDLSALKLLRGASASPRQHDHMVPPASRLRCILCDLYHVCLLCCSGAIH
jgi:hypothetical protein